MAVRSGAGTGVVVSLVVFVLITVFLLVLTIVFYAGKTKELEAKTKAENDLKVYVMPQQRSQDLYKQFEAARGGDSVAGYLNTRVQDVMNYVAGDPSTSVEKLKADMGRFGVPPEGSVRQTMQKLQGDLTASRTEIDGLGKQVKDLTDEVAQKEAQLKQAQEAHQQQLDGFEAQIASYRDSADEYRKKLDEAIDDLNKAKDSLRVAYEGEKLELQNENDDLSRRVVLLQAKLNEFEAARNADRIRGEHPGMLVDGRIVDAPGSNDEVFIDRGKKDRIVLGMTFEVYADQSQIRPNPNTGELPRGKASLQVTKVADTTSTGKITRSSPNQPIIRGDVIANAVYDPKYQFKFLIHGKFDIDGDGKPTETEAEYLRSLVIAWGGAVVTGEELPGDLDFLVLGAEPPKPPPLPNDAPMALINDAIKKNEAHEKYNQLFRQASEAQIPVLNANRFFILIGHTDR